MREKKVWFKNSKGQKLCGFLYIPDGKGPFPAVVFIHGFGGGTHEPKNKYMCKALAKVGIVTLIFDLYDKPNGLSEPSIEKLELTQQLDGTKCAIDFVEKLDIVDKKRIGLTGHSLGGMTVTLYAPKDKRIKTLIIQSGVADYEKTYYHYDLLGKIDLKAWKNDGRRYIPKSWGGFDLWYKHYETALSYNVYKIAEGIKCPTLIIHGCMDESVSYDQSEELLKHIKGAKIGLINGADHCYRTNNTLPIATKLVVDWFKEKL